MSLPVGCGQLTWNSREFTPEQVLAEIAVHDLAVPADSRYAEIRVALERQGRPIGQNDLFIAAQCLALDLTLVTDNEREFSRVPGLRIENWLR